MSSGNVFRLAHLSDVHLGPLPTIRPVQLLSKRVTGYVNWLRHRSKFMQGGVLEAVVDDLKRQTPDHIAVAGDLTNLGLPDEFEQSRRWLEALGEPEYVSVIAGNHDAYVPRALANGLKAWQPYCTSDGEVSAGWPFMRVREKVAVIGLNSARATAPFMATGHFREKQAVQARLLLQQAGEQGLCRVVLIHHPPIPGMCDWRRRLYGIKLFHRMIAETGAELVLHGHTHLPSTHYIDGADGPVPVVGVAAAGQGYGDRKPPGHYNLFSIAGQEGNWSIGMNVRGFAEGSKEVAEIGETRQLRGTGALQR